MQKDEIKKDPVIPAEPLDTDAELTEIPLTEGEKDEDELVHSVIKKEEPEATDNVDPDEAVHRDHTPPVNLEGEKDIDDLMHGSA